MTTNNRELHFDINYMRGTDTQFHDLVKCSEECIDALVENQKINFLDLLFCRTKMDKARLICNYRCINKLNFYNCKFKGRWIFLYVFGFTEILSSLCALVKFVINLRYYKKMLRISKKHPLLRIELLSHYLTMSMAFISSFLFHLNENIITRNMDYFTAVLSIVMNACVTTQRNLILYFGGETNLIVKTHLVYVCGLIFFVIHLLKMLLIDFNYVYNMVVCGILICIININYFITTMYYKNKKLTNKVIILTNLAAVSSLFELSDFPPIFYLLDSHFLWHLGLLLSIKPFYKFTSKEARLYKRINKKSKKKEKEE